MSRVIQLFLACALAAAVAPACGSQDDAAKPAAEAPKPAGKASASGPAEAADLPLALVLGLAHFDGSTPLPARMEFIVREDGEWNVFGQNEVEGVSDVFHKVMAYDHEGETKLLTVAGAPVGATALVKLWQKAEDGTLVGEPIWEKAFGGKRSRMRDVEVADLFGDGRDSMAVATHDQGIVATIHPDGSGGFDVQELDIEPNTFVHEIEIGDVNGDGTLEVYATPSEPNRLDGSEQSGQVVRYVPKDGEGRVLVADLGDRHAKEILVDDVDGDGTDELYVVVEGKLKKGSKTSLKHGVEIRRYEAGTDPAQGSVIAEIDDRLCRFVTVGDVDGDGKKEMVIAAFSSGVWMAKPGSDANAAWETQNIDRQSGGFEHAALLTDLDGDGKDELYVASDKHKEVRRYRWNGTGFDRDVIYKRTDGRAVFTWNIMPVPVGLVPR
ncbi:MAG: VCBS repeat-containing protein [Myxococcota bacterium]|nr:VCBS repeat-containing protein [Myxococcota bacterium]